MSDVQVRARHLWYTIRQNSGCVNPPTVGTLISTVYNSIQTGALYATVMECFREIA